MKYLNKETNGITLSRIGLGAMRMADVQQGVDTIHAALDSGITYLNTGDFYGHGESELVIREALKTRKREDIFIAVKFGVRPQNVQNYLAYTLKRLGTDYVDLYQPARINPHIPVEDTIGAVADLVKAGYVRSVGITEIDAETLRRAHAVHPISLVEVRYSLLDRDIEEGILPTARELGIDVVTFANLFHGVIGGSNPAGKVAGLSQRMPPQAAEKLKQAVSRLELLKEMADEKNVSVSQLAIAWVLAQGNDILALVGSRTVDQLHDTVKAIDIHLSPEDLQRIEQMIPKEYASNSAMLPINLDENGLFKF